MIEKGKVSEVIERKGIKNLLVSGKRIGNVEREIEEMKGVDKVENLGDKLNVVGYEREKMKEEIERIKNREEINVEEGKKRIEDVLIKLMEGEKENMK